MALACDRLVMKRRVHPYPADVRVLLQSDTIGKEDRVGNEIFLSFFLESRVPEIDLRNEPFQARDDDVVVHTEGPIKQNQDTCHEVGKNVLERKSQCEAGQSETRHQGRDVDPHRTQGRDCAEHQ